jgi:CBS domain-containing protein
MDVAAFLALYPPFDELAPDRRDAVARRVEVEHFPAGTVILSRAGEPPRWIYVIRKGAVELEDDDVVVDLLDEGDVFGHASVLASEPPALTARAAEDTLCYLVPAAVAEEILATDRGRTFVVESLRRRIVALAEGRSGDALGPSYRTVGSLIRRAPVTCEPGASVADAAALMAAQRVSSLLVPMRGGWGILTDRDLRTRVVAARAALETPVEAVASFPAHTIAPAAMAGEALLEMFARGVHHFPVATPAGEILGVVTDTDLMGVGRHTPFAIRSAIERATDRDGAVAAARELPHVVAALVASSADPVAVGHVVALVVDALTRRLLELALERRGEPQVPWAWIAFGSAARQEQALLTDQDHGLAYDPAGADPEELDGAFGHIAAFVTDGLEAAGIPRCRGGVMAVTPSQRRPLAGWVDAFRGWIDEPDPRASELSSIAFDFRRVAGSLDVEAALDEVVRSARSHPAFIRRLAHLALDRSPPTGFVRGFVVERGGEHRGRLDVKHGGITLIGGLARAHAIAAGSAEKRTIARLEEAAAAGAIDDATAGELSEAFRFLWEVRLRHQVERVGAGDAPDDFVDPAALGVVARQGLRESFRAIARAQRQLANALGIRIRS